MFGAVVFLAHLSMLRMSFWDHVFFVVGVDIRDVGLSIFYLCTLEGTVLIGSS